MLGINRQIKFYDKKVVEIKQALKDVKDARKMAILPIYEIRQRRVYMNHVDLKHTYKHV